MMMTLINKFAILRSTNLCLLHSSHQVSSYTVNTTTDTDCLPHMPIQSMIDYLEISFRNIESKSFAYSLSYAILYISTNTMVPGQPCSSWSCLQVDHTYKSNPSPRWFPPCFLLHHQVDRPPKDCFVMLATLSS